MGLQQSMKRTVEKGRAISSKHRRGENDGAFKLNTIAGMRLLLQRLFGPLLGISFGLAVLLTSFFGNYMISLFIPILFLNRHHQWRSIMDRAISFWIIVPVTFLEYIFGMKFKVTGDTIDCDRPAVIIMNHRTRLDWMYFWAALYKINPWLLISSKIALKAELRRLPAAGSGMEASQFIFLERQVDTDKERISEAVHYYASIGNNYQVLLFPEGTDKTSHTTTKSDEYAKKNGLKPLNNLIYPRSAGFVHLINEMRRHNYIDFIYDVTIAYPVNIVQSEVNLILTGRTPQKVLFHIERIDISRVPRNEHDIAHWINELWAAKDQKLDVFYSQKPPREHFPGDKSKFIWEEDEPLHKIVKLSVFAFWSTALPVWLYHLTILRFVQVLFVYFIAVYAYVHCKYGSIERMVYVKWEQAVEVKINCDCS